MRLLTPQTVPATVGLTVSGLQCIPVGRPGTPENIGRAAAFLADDDAGFITGATFEINGGQYMD